MATAGPNAPTTASGWTNSTNIVSSNNVYATNFIIALSDGATLIAQGFGFAIPAGSTVDGITAAIERKCDAGSAVKDKTVQLLNGSGVPTGSNKADTGTYWTTSDVTATYGGAADTWSAGLTDSDINSANFGVSLLAHDYTSSFRTASVDYVSITVDYTAPLGQPMQARSRLVPFTRRARKIGW